MWKCHRNKKFYGETESQKEILTLKKVISLN